MGTNTWTYITALGSVAFGWFLSEVGQWFRTRKEDKKIRKKVLYFLLETHFTFKKLDITPIIEIFTEKIIARYPREQQTEATKTHVESFYKQVIGNLLEDEAANNIEELEENYKKSIEDLSLVDPIIAYRLKGKNNIIEIFDYLYDYFESAKEEFPDDASEIDRESEKLIEGVKPELLNEALRGIESEILEISLNIGLVTYLKAKKIINNSKAKLSSDKIKAIDTFLDKFIMQIRN